MTHVAAESYLPSRKQSSAVTRVHGTTGLNTASSSGGFTFVQISFHATVIGPPLGDTYRSSGSLIKMVEMAVMSSRYSVRISRVITSLPGTIGLMISTSVPALTPVLAAAVVASARCRRRRRSPR